MLVRFGNEKIGWRITYLNCYFARKFDSNKVRLWAIRTSIINIKTVAVLLDSTGLTARKYPDPHPRDTRRQSRIWMKKQTTWRARRYQAKEELGAFLSLGFVASESKTTRLADSLPECISGVPSSEEMCKGISLRYHIQVQPSCSPFKTTKGMVDRWFSMILVFQVSHAQPVYVLFCVLVTIPRTAQVTSGSCGCSRSWRSWLPRPSVSRGLWNRYSKPNIYLPLIFYFI
jgi:hypothetical protein